MLSKREREELRRIDQAVFPMPRCDSEVVMRHLPALLDAADERDRLREGLRQEIELLMESPLFYPIGEKLKELLNGGGDDGDE